MGTRTESRHHHRRIAGHRRRLVKAYRDRNYRVVANSRSIKPSNDPDILTVAGDIADPATAERIVARGVERFGRIDTLVNNAGIFIAKPFTEYTAEDYANVLAINLAGFFHITQARRRRDGEAGFGPYRAASRRAWSTTPTAACRRCSPR